MYSQHLLPLAIFRILSVAAIGLLASPSLSLAAAIYFAPAGGQLDADTINDVATVAGETIAFDVVLDTTGFGSTGLLDIRYGFTWDDGRHRDDPGELELTGILGDVDFGPSDIIECAISYAICGISYTGLPLNKHDSLTVFTFSVLPALVNDGVSDFRIGIGSASINGVDVTSAFNPLFQQVEVQSVPEPSSTLGLVVLGALVAVPIFFYRKIRRSQEARPI